ncbi:MAG: preprotein translocase subunit YajC [Deltaproteobacteria bacterium]|nr:preprotein translocase subunit YajC [Deltaproteobacteria bacterium]
MKILSSLSGLFNNFAVKPAYAAGGGTTSSGGWEATLINFAPLIAIVVIFYLLVILPQQKRTKDHKKMIESLKVGDEVLTTGGIFGVITGIADQLFTIEIAKDVKIKITKSAIATKTVKQ